MFSQVRDWLKLKWSPQQIALHLAGYFPLDWSQRVSHETIYNAIYAQPRGKNRGTRIAEMLSIHMRPPEVADRLFFGH